MNDLARERPGTNNIKSLNVLQEISERARHSGSNENKVKIKSSGIKVNF